MIKTCFLPKVRLSFPVFLRSTRFTFVPLISNLLYFVNINNFYIFMGNLLSSVWTRLLGREDVRILMVGLDNAGKTTILYRLKFDNVISTVPTIGFNVETVTYKNISFTVWDIGGQDKIRNLWRVYFSGSQAIIFVIDSSDRERIGEVKTELFRLLGEDELEHVQLLLFANKQDLPNAMSTTEIMEKLGLNELKNRAWFVQSACATKGEGLSEGLDWLANQIQNKSKS